MRVLILGGTRFIGKVVTEQLHGLGHEVTVVHRGKTNNGVPEGIHHIHCPEAPMGDRSWLPGMRDRLREAAPQVVVDMIPVVEADAQAVMATFRGIAGRVVAISSQDVYRAYGVLLGKESGDLDPLPITEESPVRTNLYPYRQETPRKPDDPARFYDDYDKILVERQVLSDPELPGTVLRLPMVYGANDGQHRLFEYLKRMDDGRSAVILEEGMASWRWTRGYLEDVARAIVLGVTRDEAAGRIYNVGHERAMSMAEWVEAIGRAAGWDGKVVVLPAEKLPESMQAGMRTEQHLDVDTSRIRRELGFAEITEFMEGLRRTIDWERKNPPAKIDPKDFDYQAEDRILQQA